MSMTPSIFSRSPRTEAAQPPHVIFGTFRVTSVNSVAAGSFGPLRVAGAVASVAGLQPTEVAATPEANSRSAVLYIWVPLLDKECAEKLSRRRTLPTRRVAVNANVRLAAGTPRDSAK